MKKMQHYTMRNINQSKVKLEKILENIEEEKTILQSKRNYFQDMEMSKEKENQDVRAQLQKYYEVYGELNNYSTYNHFNTEEILKNRISQLESDLSIFKKRKLEEKDGRRIAKFFLIKKYELLESKSVRTRLIKNQVFDD